MPLTRAEITGINLATVDVMAHPSGFLLGCQITIPDRPIPPGADLDIHIVVTNAAGESFSAWGEVELLAAAIDATEVVS